MDNMIKVFESNEFGTVRTDIDKNGKVLFCAKDVATALGYIVPRKAVLDHCRYVLKRNVPHPQSPDKTIEMSFIPESDVYRLAFSSKLPNAERFTDWVTEVVLPSIRQTGGYIAGEESYTEDELVAKAFLVVQAKLEQREQRIAELTEQNKLLFPKAEFADAISGSKGCITVKQMAHLLTQNGYPIGQNRLYARLRIDNYLCYDGTRRNLPKQNYIERGLFEVKEVKRVSKYSDDKIGFITLITPKGQKFFLRKYANKILSDEELKTMIESDDKIESDINEAI